jgi:hypothetical protein
MTAHASDGRERQHWESVHVYPNCGHVINLTELDMKANTTEIVTCPRYERHHLSPKRSLFRQINVRSARKPIGERTTLNDLLIRGR